MVVDNTVEWTVLLPSDCNEPRYAPLSGLTPFPPVGTKARKAADGSPGK